MMLFKCLFAAFLLPGFDQGVLITMLSRDYTTNPEYVNTTVNAGNATHLGEVNFCFSREISAFSVTHIVKSDEGKTLLRRTVSSCDKKGLINIKRMLRIILGLGPNEKAEDFIPFTWICPIKKGLAQINPVSKIKKLTLYVPSFLAASGSYQSIELYKTANGEPVEQFLTLVKRYTVKVIEN